MTRTDSRDDTPGRESRRTDAGAESSTRPDVLKDPEDWTTGDEPMTASQLSYLRTLATEAGEEIDESMTKAEASKRIDELQERTGRGAQRDAR